MLLSVNWLKDYVDINDIPVKEYADKMILSGSNIETVEPVGSGISGVKVGKIEKIVRHPDADRLVVCQMNVGGAEPVQVVTGAANVYEGAFVPVALHGAVVPAMHGSPDKEGGFKIKKGKMRGVQSEGMLCGPQELGFDDKVAPYISKDGIWLLPGDWDDKLGQDFVTALGLEDHVIDFEITPNRPDCLCMVGMARETAATFGRTLNYPETECEETDENASDYIGVEVESDLCRRYTARVIKDVKIEQSPWWLQKRLMAAGMRPINNIVDITNFVMLEYGQPLHAFDIETLAGGKIVIKTAEDGVKFTTLDGVERELKSDMLMINDAEKPTAIAGIMGGLDSDIRDTTKTVVLESAVFDGNSVRLTSKALGLRTEASGRFEKGLDPNNCEAAADRFCKLIQLLGCGKVLNGSVDVYKYPEEAPTVCARVSRINKVLGTDIPREQMVKYLEGLEMNVAGDGDEMFVTPPTVRQDLLEEVDYVEEIARMYGYDNLPMTLPKLATKPEFTKSWTIRSDIRKLLSGMGASEIQTYAFSNQKILDMAGVPENCVERDLVRIINPMGDDTEYMRTLLSPNLFEVMSTNLARNNTEFRGYEIGIVFNVNLTDGDALPEESYNMTIGTYGEEEDFFSLKGMIEELLDRIGVGTLEFRAEAEYGMFHPGRCARFYAKDENGGDVEIGIMGEIHPDVRENFGIGVRAYSAEIDLETVIGLADRTIEYRKPPVYPSTSRDVALVVDEELKVGDIEAAIRASDNTILEDVELFDIYRGDQVPEGKKSVAYSLTYRSEEKTLTDEEANEVHNKIVEKLKEEFGASIRD